MTSAVALATYTLPGIEDRPVEVNISPGVLPIEAIRTV